jgi:isoleucyl-tRNA synthetase
VTRAYEEFTFHQVFQLVHQFCVTDMGGFYLDILKDRLYTTGRDSVPRKSAQTAMFYILESLVRWLAPVLSFTAEEIWRFMPGERSKSVFLETWYQVPEVPNANELLKRWKIITAMRDSVSQQIEGLRNSGDIGSSLDAEISLYATGETLDLLHELGDELRFVFITSYAHVFPHEDREGHGVELSDWNRQLDNVSNDHLAVEVVATDKGKCVRCWHHREDVGSNTEHPEACARCIDNVEGKGESRQFA